VRRSARVDLCREAVGLAFPSSADLPIRLRTASLTLARPFACILSLSAAMILMTALIWLSAKLNQLEISKD
jgi:hypothetical protein